MSTPSTTFPWLTLTLHLHISQSYCLAICISARQRSLLDQKRVANNRPYALCVLRQIRSVFESKVLTEVFIPMREEIT
jgi:hypothetical protein